MQLLLLAVALFAADLRVVTNSKDLDELKDTQFNVTTENNANSTDNITTAFAAASTILLEQEPLKCFNRLFSGKTEVNTCNADATACQYLEIVNWGVVSIFQTCVLNCGTTVLNNAACTNTKWYNENYDKVQRACCCDYDLCNDGNDPDPLRPVITVPPEEPVVEGRLKCYGNYNGFTEIVTCAAEMSACIYHHVTLKFSGNETSRAFLHQSCVPSCSFMLYNRCNDSNRSFTNGIQINTHDCCCDSNICNDGSEPRQISQPPPPTLEIYLQESDCRAAIIGTISMLSDLNVWSGTKMGKSSFNGSYALSLFQSLTYDEYKKLYQAKTTIIIPTSLATITTLQGPVVDFQSDYTDNSVTAAEYLQPYVIPTIFLQYVPYPLKDQDGVNGICPAPSTQDENGTCQCPKNLSGPFCLLQCNLEQMYFQYRRYCADKSCDASTMYTQFSSEDYMFHCLLKHNISVLDGKIFAGYNNNEIIIRWQLTNLPMTLIPNAFAFEITSAEENLTLALFNETYMPNVKSIYHLRKTCYNTVLNCIILQLLPFAQYSINLKLLLRYDGVAYNLPVGKTSLYSTDFLITNATINATGISITLQLHGYCPESIYQIEVDVSCNNWNNLTSALTRQMKLGECLVSLSYTIYAVTLDHQCYETDVFIKMRGSGVSSPEQFSAWSDTYHIPAPPKTFPYDIVIPVIVAVALVVILGVYIIYRRHKLELRKLCDEFQETSAQTADIDEALRQIDPNRALIEQTDYLPYLYRYEIDNIRLKIGHEIGHGQFGSVKIGKLHHLYANIIPLHDKVAIKQPKFGHNTAEDLRVLLSELKVMIAIGAHVNVVRLIGAVTKRIPQGELYIVMELCERSLLSKLKEMSWSVKTYGENNSSPDSALNLGHQETENGYQPFVSTNGSALNMITDLMLSAYQIANGMIFISSKNIVHRDLAARNILVTENNIIRIADVGLARQIDKEHYAMKNGGTVPIASMAIETFKNNCYSTQTDIWSYGVLLWEMFSFGSNPLDGYYSAQRPKDIYNFLKSGGRLNCPKHSPTEMYSLMQNCWKENPLERLSFEEYKNMIEELLLSRSPEEFNELRSELEVPIVEIDQRTAEHVTLV